MLFNFLGVVLLATLVPAEIPSYFKVCGRRNPNFDACVTEATLALRGKLKSGIPELGVPALEPLYLESLPLSQTDILKASAKNVKFTGFPDFEVKYMHVDLINKQINTVVTFKQLVIDADLDVKAKVVIPIAGHGPIHIVADNVQADVTYKFKWIKRKGKEYMFFPSVTIKIDIKDYKAEFKPADGPDSTLATAINSAIEGGRQEILQSVTPSIEKVISTKTLEFSNKIVTHFHYDELFPDRE